MPYCTKCGSPLKDEDKFCPVCGAAATRVTREEFTVSGSNLVDRVKELLHEGNVTRVIVKDEKGNILVEIPATVGVIGTVVAPWLAVLGVIAALATKCKIVVERREKSACLFGRFDYDQECACYNDYHAQEPEEPHIRAEVRTRSCEVD